MTLPSLLQPEVQHYKYFLPLDPWALVPAVLSIGPHPGESQSVYTCPWSGAGGNTLSPTGLVCTWGLGALEEHARPGLPLSCQVSAQANLLALSWDT